ncbi:MAG: tetratricopeptide repeat protein [Bryobacterales bacterium]|nr:tetratricopeptide repeat protein [Bryobacterales bacterium]
MLLGGALLLFLFAQADHAAEGRKALEANQFAQAAEHYQKAIGADPKDWTSRFHLALSLSLLNKDPEAIAAYRQVLADQPGLYEAQLNLGILLLRQKSAAEAEPLLASASEKKPKEYRPQFYLAEARAALGQSPSAESAFRAALAIQPQSAEAALGLGRLLAKSAQWDEAEKHYRLAAADPEFRRALLELAASYEHAKLMEKAVALYRLFPDDPAARERAGALLLDGGNAGDAVPDLELAYRQSPTNANRLALATAYLRTKQAAKALPLLQQATQEEPNHLDLRLYYGRALRDQRDFQNAAREFFRATQIKPDSKEAWNELSAMLISLENYPQALAALDKAQSLGGGGENPGYYYFRAIVLDRMKEYKLALPNYQKFLSLSQGNPDEEFKSRERIKVIQKILNKR